MSGVSQAEFRGWVQSLPASRMGLDGFSLWTLKEGSVEKRKQMGWTGLAYDLLSMASPTVAAHSPSSLQGPPLSSVLSRNTQATAHRKLGRKSKGWWNGAGGGWEQQEGQELFVKKGKQ